MATIDVIVAKVRLGQALEMTREAPATIQASAGDKLLVKLPYRYDEVSRDAEAWRVSLDARLEDERHEPAVKEFRDRRGFADDARGFVQQAFDLSPGRHVLRFTVAAEFREGPWDGSTQTRLADEMEGEITIVVDDW